MARPLLSERKRLQRAGGCRVGCESAGRRPVCRAQPDGAVAVEERTVCLFLAVVTCCWLANYCNDRIRSVTNDSPENVSC